MSASSKIEWTDATWNPVRGCTKVSPGCAHCYAETFAERFRGVPGHPYEQGFDLEDVPDDYIVLVAQVMAAANWHVFQVLTKRSERLRDLLNTKLTFAAKLPHIWWGVSVENKRHGLPRIAHLRAAAPSIAFLSIEPLIEDLGDFDLTGVQWVIVGGESGAGARRMDPSWVRRIREQCRSFAVPFFFKQWGGVRKSRTGRELDGREFDEFPEIKRKDVPDGNSRKSLASSFSNVWPLGPARRPRKTA
jgi:protein gp37